MSYNFELSVSARVTAKTVEEIVKSVVEEQTGKKVATVEAKTIRVNNGFGPDVDTVSEFDGYQIHFLTEKTVSKLKSTKPEFKKDTYE